MKNNNKVKIVLIVIGICLLVVLAFFASNSSNTNTQSQSGGDSITEQAQRESAAVKDSEKKDFVEIKVSDFIELYNGEENKIVLFSRPTCGYCQIAEPILANLSYKYNFDINHVNTDEMSEDDFNNLKSTNDKFAEFGTPYLVVVSNGKIVDEVSGLTVSDNYKEFFKKYNFVNE